MPKKIQLGDLVTTKDGKKIIIQLIATRDAANKFGIYPMYSMADLKDSKEENNSPEMSSKSSDGDTIMWGT